MGAKGSASKEEKQAAAEALTDDLQQVGEVTSKSMFGGHGISHDGVMFAMVDSEARCHLRADDTMSPVFEEAGSERFDARMPSMRFNSSVAKVRLSRADTASST